MDMRGGHSSRSRSPRDAGRGGGGALPLADFLFDRGILDDRSVAFLKRSPRHLAEEVLLCLGPEVRNPSAFVTRRLTPSLEGSGSYGAGPPPPEAAAFAPRGWGPPPTMVPPAMVPPAMEPPPPLQAMPLLGGTIGEARYGDIASRQDILDESNVIMVHCNGKSQQLVWRSQPEAIAELLQCGILDDDSADFLNKVPEQVAKDTVMSLGPDVRNPSAFVTRKLKELLARRQMEGGMNRQMEAAMHPRGVGPVGSREMQMPAPPYQDNMQVNEHGEPVITIHVNGQMMQLPWASKMQAAEVLVHWGVLDETSADFLLKATEQQARQIVSSLGPEVRNPSAFVTRKLKEMMREEEPSHQQEGPQSVTFFHQGQRVTMQWPSQMGALEELMNQNILDQRSAEFLARLPDWAAREVVASLGPDVRNPSAFVTKEARKWLP